MLRALGTELWSILGVLRLLRGRFWLLYLVLFLPAIRFLVPGAEVDSTRLWIYWGINAFWLLFLGIAAIFSTRLAKRLRRRNYVRFPDGPAVAPYLPQLLILLILPPYLLTMAALFWDSGRGVVPGFPARTAAEGWALATDNVLRTQIFFDIIEIFHLDLWPQPKDWFGSTVIFISRLLLDLAFVKLVVQVIGAAWYRSRGLGRGEDKLFLLNGALADSDEANTRYLARSIGDSLRQAVDALVGHLRAGGPRAERAWQSLLTMRDAALNYLRDLHESAPGERRRELGDLIAQLESDSGTSLAQPDRRWWVLVALGMALVGAVCLGLVLPGVAGFVICAALLGVLTWMIVGSRDWLDRLAGWKAIGEIPPRRLPLAAALWSLTLLPLVILTASRLLLTLTGWWPIFGPRPAEDLTFSATLAYVLQNLLHTQVFLDILEIYRIPIAKLETDGFAGNLGTFVLRLIFDSSIIGLLVGFGQVWFNRIVHRFPVSPNAELELRNEALACGPHAPNLIGYYAEQIREYLKSRRQLHRNQPQLMVALASSGFTDQHDEIGPQTESEEDVAAQCQELGVLLYRQGHAEEGERQLRRALAIYERLLGEGRDVRAEMAAAHGRLSNALSQQRRLEEAVAEGWLAVAGFGAILTEGKDDCRQEQASALANLSAALHKKRHLAEAEDCSRGSIALLEALVAEGRKDLAPELSLVRAGLANVLADQIKRAEAVKEYRRFIEECGHIIRAGRLDFRANLAVAWRALAITLYEQARPAEALPAINEGIAVNDELLAEGDLTREVGACDALLTRGLLHRQLRNYPASLADLERASAGYEKLIREGHATARAPLASTLSHLAATLSLMDQIPRGVELVRQSLDLYQRLIDEGHAEVRVQIIGIEEQYAGMLARQNQQAEAVATLNRALERSERLLTEGHHEERDQFVRLNYTLGQLLYKEKQYEQCEAVFGRGLPLLQALVREGRAELRTSLARAHAQFGYALEARGNLDEAIRHLAESHTHWEQCPAEEKTPALGERARLLHRLGQLLRARKRLPEASNVYTRAATLFQQLLDGGQVEVQAQLEALRAEMAALKTQSPPPPSTDPVEHERQRIGQIVQQVNELSRQSIAEEEYYPRFIRLLRDALGAKAVAVWRPVDLSLLCEINFPAVGLTPGSDLEQQHRSMLQGLLVEPRIAVLPPGSSLPDGTARNTTPHLVILGPVVVKGAVAALVELFLDANRSQTAWRGFGMFVQQMTDHARAYHTRRTPTEPAS